MLFTDPIFLFYFLPGTLLTMRLLTHNSVGRAFPGAARIAVFLLTCFFYGFREPWWLIPFLLCIVFDFFWASRIHSEQRPEWRRFWLVMSVSQNLFLLGIFKYRAFFLDNLAALGWAPSLPGVLIEMKPLALPAGISFYTFESLSFVIDVYRREIAPPRSASEFFGFIGMFPRFIAGPIVRYRDMVAQFARFRGMQIEAGIFLFIYGLFIKIVFGDNFEVFTQYAFGRETVTFWSAWVGAASYTFHIYFDFSGYSLMAIGLGRALGFQFPTNFNRPYLAVSAQDFWRRWHISLSSWLRDYLYVSLGGNRKGKLRTYINLFLTMLLGGLWHGAAWHFALWGAFHGAWLAFERRFPFRAHLSSRVNWALTFGIVVVGWVLFRAESVTECGQVLRAMLWPTQFGFNPEGLVTHPISAAACALGLAHCFWFERRYEALVIEKMVTVTAARVWTALAMLGSALVLGFSERTIPFIYFQF
ncbi:MAG: MBOAT family protein [Deltaproteobacteria bacterium]|nr:MBOAT family protein [Deltaproteobacteria bacterium]